MIKIGNQRTPDPTNLTGLTPAQSAGLQENEPSAFSKALERTQAALRQETMEKLLSMVDLQAQRLLKSPIPAEITVYRELIRRFLKEATAKMGKLEKKTDRRNRPLVTIREVDEKLAELTEKVVSGQAKPIEILALVNEIRGLLVDFLV